MPGSDHPAYRQPTGADRARESSDAQVLDSHRVHRDGSVWACQHCGSTWPFPAPVPTGAGPCSPRRWGDQ